MKKFSKLLILMLAAIMLSGCMRTVDQMYRLPKRSDAYIDLQSSIDKAMSGLTYCAPLTGENQQTVQMADLDGDSVPEYLVFAKSSHEKKPLRILVFRNVEGTFVNTDTVECNGSAFDQVEYVDMDGNGGAEMVIGRQLSDQIIRSVSVYTLDNDELIQLVSATYSKFMTTDLDNDNSFELFLLRPGQTDTDNGVAELYSMENGVMERYNEVSMSQPVDKLKRMIIGKLDGGATAVFTACAAGENALITDIYSLADGLLKNVALSNESGTAVQTLRNYYVYADDIDADGIVELPYLIPMKPMDEMVASDTHQLIRWYAMTPQGDEVDKMYTYHNFVGGWYMQLDQEWAPRLVVKNMGNQYDFYLWDAEYKNVEKLLTIYAHSTQTKEEQPGAEALFVLLKTDSTVYAAQLETAAEEYGLTQDSVIYSFRLIQKDWKTGET